MSRLRTATVLVGLLAAGAASTASGYWMSPAAPGSHGFAKAGALPAAATPTVSALGPAVTVNWTPVAFSEAALDYVVTRRASSGGVPTGVPVAVPCAPTPGPGRTLECVESPTPAGVWHYAVTTALGAWRGPESAPTAALTVYDDTTPPTTTALRTPAPPASGWHAGTVDVTLSAVDDLGGSGVEETRYTLDGSDPRTSPTSVPYLSPVTIASTTTVRFASRDRANHWETPRTETVQIDSTAPTNALSLTGATGAHLSGTTVFYRGAAAGSFAVANAVADAGGSGVAASATSALAGTTAGWTHTPGSISTPAGGPFVSAPFAWSAGTTSAPAVTVTGSDGAGNSDATVLTFTDDSLAPAPAASATPVAGPTGWNTGSVTLTLSATDNSGGSGVASIRYTTDGSNPATSPTASVYAGPLTIAASTTVRFVAIDQVGNTSGIGTHAVQIDADAPTHGITLANVSGGAFVSGSTVFYRGVAAGSFSLSNAVTDAGSGPASSTTTALAGTAAGWTHTASTVGNPANGPYVSAPFAWVAGTSSEPSESVVAMDRAGNSATSTLVFRNDSAPPADAGGFPDAATYATGSAWSAGCGTPATADVCGTATDGGAGVAAVTLVIRRLSDNRCWNPANGRFQPPACSGVSPTAFTGGGTATWSVDVPCAADSYTLDVTLRDNVGNSVALPQRAWQTTACAG